MPAANKYRSYHDQNDIDNTMKLREITATLPPFCREFFLGIKDTTSTRTRLAYAYDIRIFFEYLHEVNPVCRKTEITEFDVSILDMIKPIDITEYMDYLSYYIKDGEEYTNDERGKQRKLASLRSMYNYFFRTEKIEKNPASLVQMPKLHNKEIIRLDIDEVARLLDNVENGDNLTKKQLEYHNKTKTRDLALLTLLLGTGIRVSECVGLDIKDVDFSNNGILIKRKGGYEQIVYFGDEVEAVLREYMEERHHMIPMPGHEQALFLSLQDKRLSVRSVQNLVKKYARTVTTLKKITPHKLRSTYGTSLYNETGDIYLVADVLGHKDVNTTKKHYAAQDQNRLRMAANAVKLRES
ncbi:MAG: tyrosine-type recombinase/integrase [Lachnospiraceae bacterium]|nr:tyrosine-type recombinase/integrase [Lachnospiraceae bacterium]